MNDDLPLTPPTPERESAGPASADATRPAGLDTVVGVGARLSQLRIERGMSVGDVSARLKVSPTKLKALEAGDLSLLPDATFCLGIARSYAKMLGADPATMIPALRLAYGSKAPDLSMPASSGANLPRGKMAVNWRAPAPRRLGWVWGLVVVVLAAVALLVWRDGREPSTWLARFLPHETGGAAGASAAAADSTDHVAQAQTPGNATQAADSGNQPGSAADAFPSSEANAEVQAQTPVPEVSAPPSVAPSAVVTAPAAAPATAAAPAPVPTAALAPSAAALAPASAPASAPAGADGANATLTFTLMQDSWISVRQKDGREVFSGLAHAGDSPSIQGVRPLKVIVGNERGVASMQVDGQAVDAKQYLNVKGNVARFTLP
ncbi:helix-turn-helix domain-containing protein [Burkholderia sp. L27(2015)]|uniref:helix-turn-helix domain-containing protein n=1 Tax=Burkholderia sp. L27(2015) TaxID=1641858 RepID=UPI00131A72CD|nr:helix-turn-helix domain-containing protein [Burkholderia sp. L27(2015)]